MDTIDVRHNQRQLATSMNEFVKRTIPLCIGDTKLEISAISRQTHKPPILFLHGFGSTKEEYADIVRRDALAAYSFLAYDAPGCGETDCSNLDRLSIPFLVETVLAVLTHENIGRFHLIGHSMGGLTALMLAHRVPERILSFINIEGNIAPEDCFLSRQIVEHPAESADQFFEQFIGRTLHSPAYSSPLYAASLKHKVRAQAVPHIFRSMVHLSDHGELIDKFLSVPCPKMFMYGEQNRSLSYLDHIEANGVTLAEIPECGHFPMYANPPAMWQAIATFLNQH